jgi:hypothetical protein
MNKMTQLLRLAAPVLLVTEYLNANELSIPPVLPPAGLERSLVVNFENSSEVVGVQFDLYFDPESIVVSTFPETLLGTDHQLVSRRLDGFTRIVLYSPGNSQLADGSTVLVTARLLSTGPIGGSSLEFRNIIYTNASGDEIPVTQPLAPLEAWRADSFTEAELLNLEISGPNADPDGDGARNLAEFASGTNPRLPQSSGERSGFQLSLTPDLMLEARFWLARNHRGADVFLQSSDELTDWQTVIGALATGEETASRFEISAKVPAGSSQKFLRLRIEEQETQN